MRISHFAFCPALLIAITSYLLPPMHLPSQDLAQSAAVADQSIDSAGHSEQRMTPELLWELGRLGSVAVSPDGNQIAYAVRHYDLSKNSGRSTLYVLDRSSGKTEIWLENWKSIGSLAWIKRQQQERLWFAGIPPQDDPVNPSEVPSEVADGGSPETALNSSAADPDPEVRYADKTQAYFLVNGQTAPVQSTAIEKGIANLKIAPSGNRMAFSMPVKMRPTTADVYPDLPLADAKIIDGLMYRHWDRWQDENRSHLHVAKIDARGIAQAAIDLMPNVDADCPVPPFGGSEHFDWHPSGAELAYTLKDVPDWAMSTNTDIFTIPFDQSAPAKNLSLKNLGYDNNPLYSPNGQFLAYNSMKRPGFEADRNRLMIYDIESGKIQEASAGLDQNVNHFVWLPDSSGLVFDSEIQGTNQLFHLDLSQKSVRQISSGRYNWQALAVFPSGKSLLASRMSMLHPHELVELPLNAKGAPVETGSDGNELGVESRVLTKINDHHFEGLQLPTVEERFVEASDGKQIHCWVIYPPGFDPQSDKKWPLLTYCQGGPQSQIGQWFSFRWNFHLMAANDYIIVAVNRRGLPGFGQKWNDDISQDWGGQAMQDLLAATDHMTAQPFVDSKRVAAVGASFGGYSVYWLMGNAQDRFCTMISHCGVFNLESMYGSTEELFFVNHDLGGPYWASPEIQQQYLKFSPHQFVGNWKTPLLVIHGEKDFRVPITQGMEAFTAAQVQGVPSRFLYFPAEGHWVQGPQNGVLWHRVFFEWLDRFCKSDD